MPFGIGPRDVAVVAEEPRQQPVQPALHGTQRSGTIAVGQLM